MMKGITLVVCMTYYCLTYYFANMKVTISRHNVHLAQLSFLSLFFMNTNFFFWNIQLLPSLASYFFYFKELIHCSMPMNAF